MRTRLEVDDESPSWNDIVLPLLPQRGTIVRRIDSVIVAQLRPYRNGKKQVKRRADIHAATELCRSGIPVYRRIGCTVVK